MYAIIDVSILYLDINLATQHIDLANSTSPYLALIKKLILISELFISLKQKNIPGLRE